MKVTSSNTFPDQSLDVDGGSSATCTSCFGEDGEDSERCAALGCCEHCEERFRILVPTPCPTLSQCPCHGAGAPLATSVLYIPALQPFVDPHLDHCAQCQRGGRNRQEANLTRPYLPFAPFLTEHNHAQQNPENVSATLTLIIVPSASEVATTVSSCTMGRYSASLNQELASGTSGAQLRRSTRAHRHTAATNSTRRLKWQTGSFHQ